MGRDNSIELAAANGVRLRGFLILKETQYDRHMVLTIEGGRDDGMTIDFRFQEPY